MNHLEYLRTLIAASRNRRYRWTVTPDATGAFHVTKEQTS